jgi:hypothetical protein
LAPADHRGDFDHKGQGHLTASVGVRASPFAELARSSGAARTPARAVILGTPLAAVGLIVVRESNVHDALGDPTV